MPVQVIVGTQWGDEGKGKIVDLLAERVQVVARCQGGPNAGHTVAVGDATYVLHLVPSGALYPEVRCVIGNGVVVHPPTLFDEIEMLAARGIQVRERLTVDARAHVILPLHGLEERADEARRGRARIGTTMRGIGPAYESKVGRRGVRVADLLDADRLRASLEQAWRRCRIAVADQEPLAAELPPLEALIEEALAWGRRLRPHAGDVPALLERALARGERLLVECAQGTFLDVDQGTYPFVTSSNTVAGGACTGLGLGPRAIDRVSGVTKAYTTRVGAGPFPGELEGAAGEALREAGAEYGATTGRPRRCGWLDLVALRRAARLNSLDELVITKLDVLDGRAYVKVIVDYEADPRGAWYPLVYQDVARPVTRTVAGWREPTSGARTLADLPPQARAYLDLIAEATGVAVTVVSVGRGREQTVRIDPPPPVGAAS